jgi:beta-glucanase (GH16 family)
MMTKFFPFLLLFSTSIAAAEQCTVSTFYDDFNGTSLDQSVWRYQNGDGCDLDLCGWGNNEQQVYTPKNTRIQNGHFVIKATQAADGLIESGKIITKGNFSQKYGRFEARIKVPDGLGLWPAFWLMPDNTRLKWPLSGEIDILERPGRSNEDLHTVIGAAHFGSLWPLNVHFAQFLRMPKPWHDDFHVYRLDWTPERLQWQVDDKIFATLLRSEVSEYRWPFENHPFYVILNMAVGGTLGGDVEASSFPAEMWVDYVRVSQYVDCP